MKHLKYAVRYLIWFLKTAVSAREDPIIYTWPTEEDYAKFRR